MYTYKARSENRPGSTGFWDAGQFPGGVKMQMRWLPSLKQLPESDHYTNQMGASEQHTIYTIGHSTRSMDDFIQALQSFGITMLADIRRFPGSRKYPQFNSENLAETLAKSGIRYVHMEDLGGRRKVRKDSRNDRWRNDSFRGYADYMETEDFEKAAATLESSALEQPVAFMCSEAVWWRCHRSMVSDYLKAKGWKVLHIRKAGEAEEHPYTSPARVAGKRVFYYDQDLFNHQ